MSEPATINVTSSDGYFVVDLNTGTVLSRELAPDCDPTYRHIVRFDLAEWVTYLAAKQQLDRIRSPFVDILHVNYTFEDGTVEYACFAERDDAMARRYTA